MNRKLRKYPEGNLTDWNYLRIQREFICKMHNYEYFMHKYVTSCNIISLLTVYV